MFALQQKPSFILSIASRERGESDWAWTLVQRVVRKLGISDSGVEEWPELQPFNEEGQRMKEELTRGDWRDRR